MELEINTDEVSKIVYRKDDFGITYFRHIDIEFRYGEYIEIPEKDARFEKILASFDAVDLEKEEIILYETERRIKEL